MGSNDCDRLQHVYIDARQPLSEKWLDHGYRLQPGFDDQVFPTFVQAVKRKKPPKSPAGIEGCDKKTIQRWADDEFPYPPYPYAGSHMVLDANSKEEREHARSCSCILQALPARCSQRRREFKNQSSLRMKDFRQWAEFTTVELCLG